MLALAIGLLGAAAAHFLGFPAPWLTGPALFCSVACLAGLRLSVPDVLRDAAFLVVGMTMGSSVTQETLDVARQLPIAVVMLIAGVTLMMWLCVLLLCRTFGDDRETAVLAASPGHLGFVLGLSTDTNADVTRVSIIQAVRLLFLTLAVPFVVVALSRDGLVAHVSETTNMTPVVLIVKFALSILVGWIFLRLKVPASFLLGAMLVSALGHVTDIGPGTMPDWLSICAFTIVGTLIGTRFNNLSLKVLRASLTAGVATTLVTVAVSILSAVFVSLWIDVPLPHILIAFAPGGLETMAAMAILLGADPAFVAAHHVLRLVFLTFLVPITLRVWAR